MRVRVLGGFAVDGVPERDLGSRKARTLLKVLALARGRPVAVDRLADVLWGDDPPARPADQVGVLVSRLRGVLGADRLPRTDAGYALVAEWLDVDELEALADAASEALAGGRTGPARAAARAALALARGPLLPDEDGSWVEADRAAAVAAVTRVRRLAVEAAAATGDHDGAAAVAEQVLADDPYDEVVLRALMSAHLAAGRPASALAAYARGRGRLAEDLGVSPSPETERLHGVVLAATGDGVAGGGGATSGAEHAGSIVAPHRAGDDTSGAAPHRAGGDDESGAGHHGAGGGAASADPDRASPPRSPAGGRPSPPAGPRLVGRAGELAVLDDALAVAGAGAGRVALVVVEGVAGIGKTRLVDAWTHRIAGTAAVLRGRCDELGRDLPLQPVTDAVADHLRAHGEAERAELLAGDAAVLAAVLGPVAGAAGGGATVVGGEVARDRLFAALVAVLGRIGGDRPVVLVLDDFHLAGAGTRAWLGFARIRAPRLVLVVTTRPGGAPVPDATHRIVLGPLDREAVIELVGAGRAAALHERSAGHPLLLAALADAGPDTDGRALPATVRDAVTARVDTLGDDVAATLRVAAVLGSDCDLDLVADAAERPMVEVLGHLEAATAAGLVVERGSGFAFAHELVREALEAATVGARRALVHRRAAHALAGRAHPDPLAVAVHAEAGDEPALASTWFVAAAEAAVAHVDLDAAEVHLASALALRPSAEAHTARARVRMGRLALDDAAADAERAVAGGGGATALEVAGWVAYYRRRYDEARAFADAAIARAGDDDVRISALALAGRVRHGAGDLAGAVEHLATVGDGPPAVRGIADVWLAQARVHQGRPDDALAALARPMVDPDSLAHPWAPLHLRFNRIVALGQLGRVGDALRVADDLDVAVARGGPVGQRFIGPSANARAWVLRWSGRPDEADEANRRAEEATGSSAGPSGEGFAEAHYVSLLDLADGCLLRGDLAGAADLESRLRTVDTWTGTMAWHQRHRLGLLRARLALAAGDGDAALAEATAVADDAAARGAGRYELLARAVAGLADPATPAARLAPVVEGLGRCAVLDGWSLIADLAAVHGVAAWRDEAQRLAARVVAGAGDADAARRFADARLASSPAP